MNRKLFTMFASVVFWLTLSITNSPGQKSQEARDTEITKMLLEINRSLGKIEGEMAQLRTEIGSLRAETKAEISSLRTEMKVEVKRLDDRIDGLSTGIKWFGGIISSIIIVILGFILNSLFKLARELEPAKKKKERPVPAEKALFIENEMKELKTKMDRIEETLKKSGLTVEP